MAKKQVDQKAKKYFWPIIKLNLGRRLTLILAADGITRVGELLSKSEPELARLPNFGAQSHIILNKALARNKLKLGGGLPKKVCDELFATRKRPVMGGHVAPYNPPNVTTNEVLSMMEVFQNSRRHKVKQLLEHLAEIVLELEKQWKVPFNRFAGMKELRVWLAQEANRISDSEWETLSVHAQRWVNNTLTQLEEARLTK